jgi:catechol 2,3-dioxygenase-like lactoylglutathione lyase family enzyme
MLKAARLVAFVATADAAKAIAFYRDTLGLQLVADSPFALVFSAQGVTLRVQKVAKVVVAGYTVLGWDVADIGAAAAALQSRGVVFERFQGLEQDRHGIWRTPDGSQVAWFRDPDGNLLSIAQHAAG